MSESLWIATTPATNFPGLDRDLSVDVAIVGGGISGLTAALRLKTSGMKVAVLDAHRIAEGETGHTTAHLTEAIDARYRALTRNFGREGAQLAAEASRVAIQQIERTASTLGIACGLRRLPGYLYSETGEDLDDLREEAEAARNAGVAAEFVKEVPLPFARGGVRFDHQADFHPRQYLLPLAHAIPGNGSFVFENTSAVAVHDGEPCRVDTESGVITANAVFVAANVPVNNRFFLQTKIPAYRSYAMAAKVGAGSDLQGLFWDTADPYHYTRWQQTDDGMFLIVGGEDHKTGDEKDTESCYEALEEYVRRHFTVDEIRYRWSGQIIEPLDGLPYIGRNSFSKHVYVATGFAGQGMTFGTVSGMLVSDLIRGIDNPWESLFDPTRIKPIAAAVNFVTENVDFPKHLIPDRLTSVDVEGSSLEDVSPGEGKILKLDGRKVAVSRDDSGRTIALSPVCTHMGCDVHWNLAERSWDCPCHGSRFSPEGEVLNGPAVKPL
ncbi:MAG TPA: FAD-dependent oxidoreductase, partial [Thermoanaerobaculia bacterium]|nr:FAD-dependent oxidoreductase [Thermoanaerobaculia bacterium]